MGNLDYQRLLLLVFLLIDVISGPYPTAEISSELASATDDYISQLVMPLIGLSLSMSMMIRRRIVHYRTRWLVTESMSNGKEQLVTAGRAEKLKLAGACINPRRESTDHVRCTRCGRSSAEASR